MGIGIGIALTRAINARTKTTIEVECIVNEWQLEENGRCQKSVTEVGDGRGTEGKEKEKRK